jgi:HK97 family phage major capsid protein/HK97 family phage prohead protease
MTPEDLDAAPPARLPFAVTRAMSAPAGATRADDAAMPTMTGHFSTFNDWYEVNSVFEGRFLERVAPGAFKKTIRESRGQMKVLYDHGQDPQIGNKILGPITELREDEVGPYFEVPLFDTSYNRDLAPGLDAGVYGTSFRFHVEKDIWDHSPERSESNPEGLPERTITEIRNHEFGPVTFPANPKADIGIRSTTDAFYKRSRDPEQFEELLRSAQVARTPAMAGAAARSDEPPPATPLEPADADTPRPPDQSPPDEAIRTEDPADAGSLDIRSTEVEYTTIEDKRARYEELNSSIEQRAASAQGRLPEADQVTHDGEVHERNELKKDLDAYAILQSQVIKGEARDERVERPYVAPTGVGQIIRKSQSELHSPESRAVTFEGRKAEFRDDAKRILESTTFSPLADVARSQDKINQLLDTDVKGEIAERVKYTSSPMYLRAFEKIIKAKGSTIGLSPEEQRGTALAVGVDATGGFAVPFAFDPTVIAIGVWTGAVNPYRRVCRVVNISGTDTWNALTSTVVVATRTTEAAASVEQGPTLAQPQYIVKRAQGQITASFEMFQDRTDLAAELGVLIQEAKDNEEEASWAVGPGTTTTSLGVAPPNGTSGAYTSLTTATSVTLAAADADAVEAALPVRHRFGAQWFMNRTSIRRFQTLETAGGKLFNGANYQSVGVPELDRAGNTGLRLLGYPINESPTIPTAQTANIVIGTLLSPNSYVIVERVGMSVQFIPFILNSSALATGQQALYFMYRNHAAPINVDAGRTLRYLT